MNEKPKPVAWMFVNSDGECEQIEYGTPPTDDDSITPLYAALAADPPKHPGYVIGSHWLETAYSRICAGEAEADVLRDCGWERVDDAEALRTALAAEQQKTEPVAWRPRLSPNLCFHWSRPWSPGVPSEQTVDYWNQKGAGVEYAYAAPPDDEALRRDAERYRWLRERAWFQFEFEGRYGDSGETVQELDAAIDAAMEASTAPASAAADSSTAPEAKP